MITRAHKILFIVMLLACVIMAAFLIRLRNRAEDRLQEEASAAPASIAEPAGSNPQAVTLYMPNDLDDSLTTVEQNIALPQDETAQARALLDHLVQAFAAPGSTHPISVTSGVNEVFLLPVPAGQSQSGQSQSGQDQSGQDQSGQDQLAVVDLTGALASAEPSGIEPETLTLLSMMATLHANIPSITEVHFLVDGQPRATLAGHADLTHTYMASEANPQPMQPVGSSQNGAAQ